jgi:predicted DNA-binding protein (UPF0251 family)
MTTEESTTPEDLRRRGRPRVRRTVDPGRPLRCYAPQCNPGEEETSITLLPEELELLHLIDLNGLLQEEASAIMGVSRRTVWKDLHEARRKVADALIHGKRIEIAGCERRITGECPQEEQPCPVSVDGYCRRQYRQGK